MYVAYDQSLRNLVILSKFVSSIVAVKDGAIYNEPEA